jgi:uncharacterized protein (TIGR02145 family)
MKKIILLISLAICILACTTIEDDEIIGFFETSGTFIDSRDNHEYKWMKIGNQIWMAENLAYLPSVNHVKPDSTNLPHYYIYGYDGINVNEAKATSNYAVYGVLYDWEAALTAPPAGWHLPSDAEWKQLEIELGMTQEEVNESISPYYRGTDQGTKMKTKIGWHNNGNGTNSSGFSSLPGGFRFSTGDFCTLESFGYWWSSTEGSELCAWSRGLAYNKSSVSRNSNFKKNGFSIRCIKD